MTKAPGEGLGDVHTTTAGDVRTGGDLEEGVRDAKRGDALDEEGSGDGRGCGVRGVCGAGRVFGVAIGWRHGGCRG
jgi:hypothetical protein